MAILTKAEIHKLILSAIPGPIGTRPLISNYGDLEKQLQPAGFDLTLKTVKQLPGGQVAFLLKESKELPATREMVGPNVRLDVNSAYVLECNEWFNMPNDLTGIVYPRSTLTRSGLVFCSAIVDPGYHGNLMFAVRTGTALMIELNTRFAQIVFHRHKATVGYNGQYQMKIREAGEKR
jgi:dUTP pyrophosphatase